jgi:hypothetical protein
VLRRFSTHRRSFFYAEKKLEMSTLCAHFRVLPGVKPLFFTEKKLETSTLCAHFRVLPGVKTLYLHTS